MVASPAYQALSVVSRRFLDFLAFEHSVQGGQENGNLAAPYRQLVRFGLTRADIRKGRAETELLGFVVLTKLGLRQAGGGEPARYRLTWLWTCAGPLDIAPTDDWRVRAADLRRKGVSSVRQVRAWLKETLAEEGIGRAARRRQPPARDIDSAPQMSTVDRSHLSAGSRHKRAVAGLT
jgi:hypothetical protein